MRFAICNETYQGWDLARICEHAASCGYAGLEVAPFTLADDPSTLSEQDAARVGSTVAAAGLKVTGLHWLLMKPEGLHVTTPDDAVRARSVDFAQHLVRLCAAMGGRFMVWGSPKQRDVAPGDDPASAFQRAATALRQISETAGPLGVTLALEPLGPRETNFMVYAADTVELIGAVDHPACRLHLDVKAMAQEQAPIPDVIRANKEHLVYFHANDASMRGPGDGDTDFVPIGRALRDIGYDGWVSVEVFDYTPGPEAIARDSINYLKRSFIAAGLSVQ